MIARYEKESESRVYIDCIDKILRKSCHRKVGMESGNNATFVFIITNEINYQSMVMCVLFQ